MNTVFSRRALTVVAFAVALGAPGLARGQDAPPAPAHKHHCPTCGAELPSTRCPTCGTPIPDPVDRRLDEVLRRESGDPNGPAPPPRAEAVEPYRPAPVRPQPRGEGAGDMWEDTLRLRLGMSIDAGLSALLASRIRGRHGADPVDVLFGSGGTSGRREHEHGGSFSLHGSTWLDIGRYISLEMDSSAELGRARNRHEGDGNDFGGSDGHHHQSSLEYGTIDADLIIHPVNGQFGRLDLIVGGRYLEAREGQRRHQHSVEAGMPMIGIGGMVRPIRSADGGFALELFARGKLGAFAYGGDHHQGRGDDGEGRDWRRSQSKFYAASATAEGGVRFVFIDMIGVAVGARFEYADVEKRSSWDGPEKKIDWKSVGPFVALSMEM